MSSHTGCPDGASAECGSESPSASLTTCDVAAVPRNWQPPPGEPHARQPRSAASDSETSPCAKRAPERLHRAGIFRSGWRQRHAARHNHARQIAQAGHRHHHRRQTFVARRNAEHAGAQRQRTRQPAENNRGVVAIRQAVEHARRALRPAIARVGTKSGEGNRFQLAKFFRRRLHEQSDFPMARVIAERDGLSVRRAQSALRAQDEKLFPRRIPPDSSPCRHFASGRTDRRWGCSAACSSVSGKLPGRAGRTRLDFINIRGGGVEHVVAGAHAAIEAGSWRQRKENILPSNLDSTSGGLAGQSCIPNL